MRWRVYTKLMILEGSLCLRWYWRRDTPDEWEESARGFSLRSQCEADALTNGCKPDDEQGERRAALSRMFADVRSRMA